MVSASGKYTKPVSADQRDPTPMRASQPSETPPITSVIGRRFATCRSAALQA